MQLNASALDELWQNIRAKRILKELTPDDIKETLAEAKLLCLDLLEDEQ